MQDDAAQSPQPSRRPDPGDAVDAARMSFGDHLDELRNRLLRAIAGVVVGTIVALYFGKDILEILCWPLLIVQHANGVPPHLQVLAPTAAFVAYLKIGFLSGLILTMPWVLYQIWLFVISGLYAHERRFVRSLVPASLGLFVVGVLFLYFIVLPIVLHFFIRFNKAFDLPDLTPTAFQKLLLPDRESEFEAVALPVDGTRIPIMKESPSAPENGDVWINAVTQRLIVQTPSGPLSIPLERGASSTTMQSQFALDFYISFVLMLALAFGIAFEMPIVVYFLVRSGIVTRQTMMRSRRYILLGTVIAAAMLTPPDVISQLLLAGPMYLLFELGLFVARAAERKEAEARDA
jgi:sec-independent protein translocase protein TatC